MLKRLLHLSDKGARDLKRAIFVCVLANIVLFLPFMVIMQAMQVIVAPLVAGTPLDTGRLWTLLAFGVLAAALYFIVYSAEYDKTYTTAYAESTNIRIEVAEHMRRLPLSFFNRKDLSELTTNIMGDCATVEQMMSHAVPQIAGNAISIVIVSVMLAFYDWRMTLALLFVLPISMGVIYLSRKIQKKFGERHVRAKLNVSRQIQEYLDGIKVVKAFGLSGEKSAALKAALKQMMKEAITFEAIAGSFVTLSSIVLQVGIGVVILVGVNLLTAGSLDVIKYLTFTMISTRIYAPVLAILTMLAEVMYLFTSTKRMQQLRDEPAMEGDTKVKCLGMVTIMGTICGILMTLTGHTFVPIITGVVFGLLADLIFMAGKYKSFKASVAGYAVFSLWLVGMLMPFWIMKDTFEKFLTDSMGVEYMRATFDVFDKISWTFPIMAIVGGVIGAFLGFAMLKKHFRKAGIA